MSSDAAAAELLTKARATRDDLEARLLIAAAVTQAGLSVGVQPVVVGGTAVDFYAAGAAGRSSGYPAAWRASVDIDLVALSVGAQGSMQALKEAMEAQLGFHPTWKGSTQAAPFWSRTLEHDDLDYAVEIVADALAGEQADRVLVVEVAGVPIQLRGPEDTIVSYAESGWHFWLPREWERALAVWRTMRDEIDLACLERRARERRMPGVIARVRAQEPLPETPQPLH